MKKIFLLFSVLFAMVACSSDDTTTKESEDNNNGVPDPSFLWPTVETSLIFVFTNSEGENILDPSSSAYIGDNAIHCKIYREDDYTTHHKAFNVYEERYFNGVLHHYCVEYNLGQHFAEAVDGDYEQRKVFQEITMQRMWLKGQIYFDDGTIYDIYTKIEKYNNGTYAMGANEIYINDELVFQGSPKGPYYIVIPIVKD